MEQEKSQQRAAEAAEALAAEGSPVTARTVQQRARVGMAAAAAAAREWNKQVAAAREIPEVPGPVLARVDAIWREAVEAARAEHEADREGWTARLGASEEERAGLIEEAQRVAQSHAEALAVAEAEATAARERIAALEAAAQKQQEDAEKAAAALAAAEARAATAEGSMAGLREALAALAPKG